MAMKRFYKAYTMIEILISITIVGAISSLLFPVITTAQESARTLECKNNLRTIGIGSEQYCQEYKKMPANVITNTRDSRISGRDFSPSYFLSFEGRPTGAGVMVTTRDIPIEAMYCANAEVTEVNLVDELTFRVEEMELGDLFANTSLSSYIKAGQNMPVPDSRGGSFNIGINPRFSQNQKKPVFTELMDNHDRGINALFGDNHVEFFEVEQQDDWEEGDPRIFETILNERGIEIEDLEEEEMRDHNDSDHNDSDHTIPSPPNLPRS